VPYRHTCNAFSRYYQMRATHTLFNYFCQISGDTEVLTFCAKIYTEIVVRAEWLQSLSSVKTDSRCIKMMISFNDTIIKRLKSMYISFCESYRSLDHRSTLSHYSCPISCLPLATTLIHYLSLSSVLPDCRRAPVFIALPGRAHACPLPGARPTRRRG